MAAVTSEIPLMASRETETTLSCACTGGTRPHRVSLCGERPTLDALHLCAEFLGQTEFLVVTSQTRSPRAQLTARLHSLCLASVGDKFNPQAAERRFSQSKPHQRPINGVWAGESPECIEVAHEGPPRRPASTNAHLRGFIKSI